MKSSTSALWIEATMILSLAIGGALLAYHLYDTVKTHKENIRVCVKQQIKANATRDEALDVCNKEIQIN